jgi:hypothetical protein
VKGFAAIKRKKLSYVVTGLAGRVLYFEKHKEDKEFHKR